MSQVTYVDGNRRSFTEKSDVNLDGKEFELVQLITDGETVKLRTDGAIALGVYEGKLINGQHEVTVRTLGSGGTFRVRQSAAITPGTRVMADSDNPTKVKTAAANGALPVRTLGVKLGTTNGAAGDIIEVLDVQEDITALDAAAAFSVTQGAITDNSGGEAADGTIAVVTAPTAIGATLTDNSGLSGGHDDTVAAMAAPSALTENAGAIGGASDGDLPALVDPAGDAGASVIAGVREVATRANTLATLAGVTAQNVSDVTQKVIEVVAAQAEDRAAIVALTNAIKELTTAVNAGRVDAVALKVITDAAGITKNP